MRFSRWTRLVCIYALLCLATGLSFGASLTIQKDRRLSAQASLDAASKPAVDVLADLSQEYGVPLSADPTLGDIPVSAHLSPMPRWRILSLLADLLLGQWVSDSGGYRLAQSELGKKTEAAIRAARDWDVQERLDKIAAGLKVSAQEWAEATKSPQFPYEPGSNAKLPAGFTREDGELAVSLASGYRRAIFELLLTVPASKRSEAKEYAVRVRLSALPETQRKSLAGELDKPMPPLPGLPGQWEPLWSKWDEKLKAKEALISGSGSLGFGLVPDNLGRWSRLTVWIDSPHYEQHWLTNDIHIGRYFAWDHMSFNISFSPGKGKVWLPNYQHVLTNSDTEDWASSDQTLAENVGDFQWPPEKESGKLSYSADEILEETSEKLGIDYLATRLVEKKGGSGPGGNHTRANTINTTADVLDAKWERVQGVYLFREADWPLKRDMRIPDSFFARWTARLTPERHLSIDDLAAASAELSAKQKHWWADHYDSLPLKPYFLTITYDHEQALHLWRTFTPEQKRKMTVQYDPKRPSQFENGRGISLEGFPQAVQDEIRTRLLTNRPEEFAHASDIKLLYFQYTVSDGHERDNMSFEFFGTDGRPQSGSSLWEVQHPKLEEWTDAPEN